MKGRPRVALAERFWTKVQKCGPDECWPWTGYRDSKGYGRVGTGHGSQTLGAHRAAWELTHGPITDPQLIVCHRCDNPPCCNPAHLFLGTYQDNSDDMVAKNRQATKVNEALVNAIRTEAATLSTSEIAALHGLPSGTISRIVRGRVWRHAAIPPTVAAHRSARQLLISGRNPLARRAGEIMFAERIPNMFALARHLGVPYRTLHHAVTGRTTGLPLLIALKKFLSPGDFLALFDDFASFVTSKSYRKVNSK